MSVINSVLRSLFTLLQRPLEGLPAFVGILLWSVVSAIGVLLVYKRTSNQEGLDAVKRKIHACVFEIRLFNDNLRAILQAQVEIVLHNLTYLRLSMKPMLWLLPPLVLIISQLHSFYGFRSLKPGEPALLTVTLANDWASDPALAPSATGRPPLSLELPAGMQTEIAGVWAPSLHEMIWQIAADDWGSYGVGVKLGDKVVQKQVSVSDRLVQLAPKRPDRSLLDQLEFPSEAPLPAASLIRSISISYPEAAVWCLGPTYTSQWAWMVLYFVLTMIVAFALRGPFGVTI